MMVERLVFVEADCLQQQGGDVSEPVKRAIAQLQAASVPVVVFSERDRAELESLLSSLSLSDPLIVEGGSAIFADGVAHPFDPAMGEIEGDAFVITLGCPYVQARAGLRVLANMVGHPLKGLGDFTVAQLQKTAKLSEAEAHRAKAREFSEPFMTPKAVAAADLVKTAAEIGFKVILRPTEESRFSLLVGESTGLEKAAMHVMNAYGQGELSILALSGRSDDVDAISQAAQTLDIHQWSGIVVNSPHPETVSNKITGWLNGDE